MDSTGFWIAALMPLALGGIAYLASRGRADAGEVRYGRGLRIAFVGLTALVFAAIGALRIAKPPTGDDWIAYAAMITLFAALTGPLCLEVLRLRHRYDADGIDYTSPWTRHRRVTWASVVSLRWRGGMKWLDVKTEDGDVLHFSPMTSGLEGVAALLKTRLPPRIYESAPDSAQAAVELIARGAAASLLYASAAPEALLAARTAAEDQAAPPVGFTADQPAISTRR